MIYFAFPIMYYIFWKKVFEEFGMDFMIPMVDYPLDYMVMCCKK